VVAAGPYDMDLTWGLEPGVRRGWTRPATIPQARQNNKLNE